MILYILYICIYIRKLLLKEEALSTEEDNLVESIALSIKKKETRKYEREKETRSKEREGRMNERKKVMANYWRFSIVVLISN
jgi:hypothetical protein